MDQWSSHSIKQLLFIDAKAKDTLFCTLHWLESLKQTLCETIVIIKQHYDARTKTCFLGKSVAVVPRRTCYLFDLSHPPLAPLSTTHEQMVHSRHRVTESLWRKCNCFNNYVLTATEQWESTQPQLFIENLGVGGALLSANMNSLDHQSDDSWWTVWQQCSLILLFILCLSSDCLPSSHLHAKL